MKTYHSWDVSTAIIGHCIFDEHGHFVQADFCDLRKIEDMNEKAKAAASFVCAKVDPLAENVHFVEDRLGSFSSGRTMLQVLMKLAAFNAVFTYILFRDRPGTIRHIHPSTWKASMKRKGLVIPKGSDQKKELTLIFVKSLQADFPSFLNKNGNPQPYMFDMADAYCLGKAGIEIDAEAT